jgi:hypothetical protein
MKTEELRLREKEMDHQESECTKQIEYEQMIKQSCNAAMKIQNEATQATTQLINHVLPRITPMEKCSR